VTSQSPPTVLAIEDDVEVLDIIRAHLAGAGYRVLVATGGEAGLELARTQPVDLITLDLRMSPLGGREVFDNLRADPATRDIPVVLVTVVDGLPEGVAADGYVSKPFLSRQLLGEVRRFIPLS
jgi:CheY-like chemotaxis protein